MTRVRRGRWVPSIPLLIILAILIAAPVFFVILAAFSVEVPRPGKFELNLTLDNFAFLFDGKVLTGVGNSFLIATFATLFALLIGGSLAFLAARTDIPKRRVIFALGIIPLFLPSYIGALAWAMLGSPAAGLLNTAFKDLGLPLSVDIYSIPGAVFVLAIFYAPYAFLLIHSAMSLMNPDLEDAALIHGATPRRMLGMVTFPLALPAILGSGLLIFVLVFENFPVAQTLASPGGISTLPTYLYRMMATFPPRETEAASLALLFVIFVLILTIAQRKVVARRSYATISGKGVRPKLISLGRLKWPALIWAGAYFLVSIVLPLGALLLSSIRTSPYMASFADLLQPGALGFGAFGEILADRQTWEVTLNSVVVSVAAAVGGTLLAFATAYVVYRTNARGRALIEGLSMTPLAIPSIVLGIGLLWTWLVIPLPIYGTLWVLMIAFVAAQVPQGLRSVAASIQSTQADLEDSAVVHGASRWGAIKFVTVPLMRVALSSTFLLLLMLSMRELTVPLFLYTSDTMILSIQIFSEFQHGGASQTAAALSLLYCLLMFVLSYLPRRLGANSAE